MKQLLFLLLFPCLAMAQYQGNAGQKITLGEQTTADGLVYRGLAADTTRKPSVDTMAYILLDTNTNIIWQYKLATNNAWTRVGGSISSGLTGVLPVANGGTGTGTAFTAGSVLFAGASGTYAQDNSGLFYNSTNKRLAIGQSQNLTGASLSVRGGIHIIDPDTSIFSDALIYVYPKEQTGNGTNASEFAIQVAGPGSTTTAEGPYFFIKGKNFSRISGQRGAMFLSGAQGIVSPTGYDGSITLHPQEFIEFATGDTYNIRLKIIKNGNVGIGTTSPTARLHVKGSGVTTGEAFKIENSGGTNLLTVLDNGFVGIGTPTPTTQMQLVGSTFSIIRVSSGAGNVSRFDFGTQSSPDIGRLTFSNADSSIRIRPGLEASELSLLKNGNLGISVATPTQKLHVVGNGLFTGSVTANSLSLTTPLPVANGGTGTGTAFTQGSVLFAGASGTYTQDNSGIYYNSTNKSLSIGKKNDDINFILDLENSTSANTIQRIRSLNPTASTRLRVQNDSTQFVDFILYGKNTTTTYAGYNLKDVAMFNAGNADVLIGTNNSRDLVFITSQSNRALVKDDGEFLIGYTKAEDVGAYRLQVKDNLYVGGNGLFTGSVTGARFNPTGNTATGTGMYLPSANTLGFSIANIQKMNLVSNGIGFGTDLFPWISGISFTLDFPQFAISSGASGGGLIMSNFYFNSSNQRIYKTTNGANFINTQGGAIAFSTAPSGAINTVATFNPISLYLENDGRVAIGSNTLQTNFKLTVQDSIYVNGLVSAAAYTTRSDYELKEEIQNISYGINEVMQMQPVKYTYKSNGSTQLGFIAQDLGVITPEVVSFEDKMSVYYNALIPILTKAIQEQQALIKALEQRILILENK